MIETCVVWIRGQGWMLGHKKGFYIKTHTVCSLISSIRSCISLWKWIVFNTHCGRQHSQNHGSMRRVSTWSITVNNSAAAPTPVLSNAADIILFTHLSVVYLLYFILASTEIRNKGTVGSHRWKQLCIVCTVYSVQTFMVLRGWILLTSV